MERVLNLHGVQVFVPRFHVPELEQVLMQEWEHLQSDVNASHEYKLLVCLTESDQVITANYSGTDWYKWWF